MLNIFLFLIVSVLLDTNASYKQEALNSLQEKTNCHLESSIESQTVKEQDNREEFNPGYIDVNSSNCKENSNSHVEKSADNETDSDNYDEQNNSKNEEILITEIDQTNDSKNNMSKKMLNMMIKIRRDNELSKDFVEKSIEIIEGRQDELHNILVETKSNQDQLYSTFELIKKISAEFKKLEDTAYGKLEKSIINNYDFAKNINRISDSHQDIKFMHERSINSIITILLNIQELLNKFDINGDQLETEFSRNFINIYDNCIDIRRVVSNINGYIDSLNNKYEKNADTIDKSFEDIKLLYEKNIDSITIMLVNIQKMLNTSNTDSHDTKKEFFVSFENINTALLRLEDNLKQMNQDNIKQEKVHCNNIKKLFLLLEALSVLQENTNSTLKNAYKHMGEIYRDSIISQKENKNLLNNINKHIQSEKQRSTKLCMYKDNTINGSFYVHINFNRYDVPLNVHKHMTNDFLDPALKTHKILIKTLEEHNYNGFGSFFGYTTKPIEIFRLSEYKYNPFTTDNEIVEHRDNIPTVQKWINPVSLNEQKLHPESWHFAKNSYIAAGVSLSIIALYLWCKKEYIIS